MLKELKKDDWLSMLNIPEDRIPQALILRGARCLRSFYSKHKEHFSDILEVKSPNAIIEDVFIGKRDDINIGYASVYGAPMTADVVHIFGCLGTKVVIQTGWCGGLADDLQIGDIVLPTSAYCGDGASQYYTNEKRINESIGVRDLDCIRSIKPHFGPLFSTSALLAESSQDIEDWYNQGYWAIDMETATCFAVAKHFEMKFASILSVFDTPRSKDHILTQGEELNGLRENSDQNVIGTTFEMIKETLNVATITG